MASVRAEKNRYGRKIYKRVRVLIGNNFVKMCSQLLFMPHLPEYVVRCAF
jgi:hypothetical protein